ncbi:MAG TPA: SDR family oxidoreductase [Candidatus Eisenbacteria bacterium]|nr:SDR family oxidoreductase [Candidatus Eisenbacteria bacterium]
MSNTYQTPRGPNQCFRGANPRRRAKTAALEYADENIRVNAVCPGYIETNMTRDTMQRRGDQILATVPFHRMGKPEEIAEMVVWLCSDRASFVSGAAYNVDGGYMAT